MRTVTVTGYAAARAVPDRAVVRVAAVHRGPTLAEALAGAESARAAVVAASGDVVVSSTDLSVWPSHDHQGRPSGFEARHALRLDCPSLAVAGTLVGDLADAVGDRLQVEGVSLVVGDPSSALTRAREAALADARARAEHLAGLTGCALGEVQQLVEGPAGPGSPRGAVTLAAGRTEVSLEPGESEIAGSVTVTWLLV